MEGFVYHTVNSGVIAISAANALLFQPVEPVEVVRVGCLVSIDVTVAAAVITGNIEQLGGAALTPSQAAALGTMTVPVGIGIGNGVYKELAEPRLLVPGEQLELISDAGPTAGSGIIWAQYRTLSFVDSTINRNSADAITAPVADATWLQRYTKVSS